MEGQFRAFGPPEIFPEDIVFDEKRDLIGKGAYGAVYRARCRGHEVAVKIPNEQNLNPLDLEAFKKEVTIMSLNAHPNVVRLMGACTVPGKLQIVTERCLGDVESLLYDPSYNGLLVDRLKMARDTASGMNWLHALTGTIHGDLKPANLLVDEHVQVKIADFGFGQLKKEMVAESVVRGSVMWMAPEKMMRVQPITEKIDVFSFGIILWEIIHRKKPYSFDKYTSLKDFCEAVCFRFERPELTEEVPITLRSLMADCWHPDPRQRCSFREIVSRLNFILIDGIITIPSAAAFWKSKIIRADQLMELHEYTGWTDFLRGICEEIGTLDADSLAILKDLLVKKMPVAGRDCECVTMARFNQVTLWFGPFYQRAEGIAAIAKLNELFQKPWFHGEIDPKQAAASLANEVEGTFLLRLSSTDPAFPFTLSTPKGHFKVKRAHSNGVEFLGKFYPSLETFVEANGNKLKSPCPKNNGAKYLNPSQL